MSQACLPPELCQGHLGALAFGNAFWFSVAPASVTQTLPTLVADRACNHSDDTFAMKRLLQVGSDNIVAQFHRFAAIRTHLIPFHKILSFPF